MRGKIAEGKRIVEYTVYCCNCENVKMVYSSGRETATSLFRNEGWGMIDGNWKCPQCINKENKSETIS